MMHSYSRRHRLAQVPPASIILVKPLRQCDSVADAPHAIHQFGRKCIRLVRRRYKYQDRPILGTRGFLCKADVLLLNMTKVKRVDRDCGESSAEELETPPTI